MKLGHQLPERVCLLAVNGFIRGVRQNVIIRKHRNLNEPFRYNMVHKHRRRRPRRATNAPLASLVVPSIRQLVRKVLARDIED